MSLGRGRGVTISRLSPAHKSGSTPQSQPPYILILSPQASSNLSNIQSTCPQLGVLRRNIPTLDRGIFSLLKTQTLSWIRCENGYFSELVSLKLWEPASRQTTQTFGIKIYIFKIQRKQNISFLENPSIFILQFAVVSKYWWQIAHLMELFTLRWPGLTDDLWCQLWTNLLQYFPRLEVNLKRDSQSKKHQVKHLRERHSSGENVPCSLVT